MPDFERIIDDLRIHIADTPEEKAFWTGYQKGKTRARVEILIMLSVAIITFALLRYF